MRKLNPNEKKLFKLISNIHKCPWYLRIFHKEQHFDISEHNSSGIGSNIFIKCSRCGQIYDITDYDVW